MLLIKSVQRLKLFGEKKDEILEANVWEVFNHLDLEVLEDDYRENLKKNINQSKKGKTS